MNDPLLNTTGISTKVALQARCYGNGVDIVVVDMQHRILLRSALSFDNWGKFVSGREAVEMATMHAPVLHDLVNQALAPLDHKVQIVSVEKAAPKVTSPTPLAALAEPFFEELFRLLQKHRVYLSASEDISVTFDDTYRPSECLMDPNMLVVSGNTGAVMSYAEQTRVIEHAMKAAESSGTQPGPLQPTTGDLGPSVEESLVNRTLAKARDRVRNLLQDKWKQSLLEYIPDDEERTLLQYDIRCAVLGIDGENEGTSPSAKVTMDGVLSEAKSIFVERMDVNGNGAVGIDLSGPPRAWAPAKPEASCKPTDPATIDYSLAPALVDVKGMHRHRLADNPEEKRFADAFHRDFGIVRSNLRHLLRPASEQSTHALGFISDRDREVAATMIQWLGSPVGQGFLFDLGYEKTPPHRRRPASGTSI